MKSAAQIFTQPYHSPCGEMVLGDYAGKLCLCDWANGKHRRRNDQRIQHFFNARYVCGSTPLLQATAKELDAWFAGALVQFNLPLAMGRHTISATCVERAACHSVWSDHLIYRCGACSGLLQWRACSSTGHWS